MKKTGEIIPFILILAVVAGLYGPAVGYSFHFDDSEAILENEPVHLTELSARQIAAVLSLNRPAAQLLNALNYHFSGPDPAGFRAVNILIHALAACSVYLLFRQTLTLLKTAGKLRDETLPDREISLLGALLWSAHPVQTEAVTYIVQRMTSLAALFALLSLNAYILARRTRRTNVRLAAFVSFAGFALLAFGTKENTLLLPLLVGGYELSFISGFTFKRAAKPAVGLAILLSGGIIWMTWIYRHAPFDLPGLLSGRYMAGEIDPVQRIMTEWRVLVLYLSLLIFPFPDRMNLGYDLPLSVSLFEPPSTCLSLLFLSGLGFLAIRYARRYPLLSFSYFWFLVNLAIESSFLKIDLVYEHRLYLPSVMIFLPVSLALFSSSRRLIPQSPGAPVIIGAVLLLLLGGGTIQRNRIWKNEVTLWSDVVSKSPRLLSARLNLGQSYLAEGDFDHAIESYQEALRINGKSPKGHNDLGAAYLEEGKMADAAGEFLEAIRLAPDYPRPHFNLGEAYFSLGQDDRAFAEFKRALELGAGTGPAETYLGILLAKRGEIAASQKFFEAGARMNPDCSFCRYHYGNFLEASGRREEARSEYREALRALRADRGIPVEWVDRKLKGLGPP